jgi:hypothetical protein
MTKKQLLKKLELSEELEKIAFVPVAEVINWVNKLEEKSVLDEQQIKDIARAICDQNFFAWLDENMVLELVKSGLAIYEQRQEYNQIKY